MSQSMGNDDHTAWNFNEDAENYIGMQAIFQYLIRKGIITKIEYKKCNAELEKSVDIKKLLEAEEPIDLGKFKRKEK